MIHWHMCDRYIRYPMAPAYFTKGAVEEMIATHERNCHCGLWDIMECTNLMCIVEAMT